MSTDPTQALRPFDRLRSIKVPEFLWHYTSASGLFEIVRSKTIWATKIQYLNDSQEFVKATNLCRSLLQQISDGDSDPWHKQLIALLMESLGGIKDANICVCSFTEECDLLSQWRGYCPPAGGYCLGVDSESLIKNFSVVNFTILPCVYDYFQQRELMDDVISIVLPELFKIPPTSLEKLPSVADVILKNCFRMIYEVAPIIKESGFAEEKEWRAVSAPMTFNKLNVRPQGSVLKPYLEVPLTLQNAEVKVVVGPGSHMDLGLDSSGILISKIGAAHAQVQPSMIPFRSL